MTCPKIIRDIKIRRRDERGRLAGSKFTQPSMHTTTLDLSLCRPRLVENAISPDLPSCREREYSTLGFAIKMLQSTLLSVGIVRDFKVDYVEIRTNMKIFHVCAFVFQSLQ